MQGGKRLPEVINLVRVHLAKVNGGAPANFARSVAAVMLRSVATVCRSRNKVDASTVTPLLLIDPPRSRGRDLGNEGGMAEATVDALARVDLRLSNREGVRKCDRR